MALWEHTVEILRESIFAYTQVCNGNLGIGILVVTFLARLALIPLGIKIAKAMAMQQRAMARIQPELDALRQKYKDNPGRLAEATSLLMKREKVSPLNATGCLGSLAQLPVFVALYASVRQAANVGGRFLWIRNLAQPDWTLTFLATLLTLLATASGAQSAAQNRSLMLLVTTMFTLVALSKMAAGVALYWAVSSVFGAAQGWVVQRNLRSV